MDLDVVLADAAESLTDQGPEFSLRDGDAGADTQDHGGGVYERDQT
jgi:hypothetical protein